MFDSPISPQVEQAVKAILTHPRVTNLNPIDLARACAISSVAGFVDILGHDAVAEKAEKIDEIMETVLKQLDRNRREGIETSVIVDIFAVSHALNVMTSLLSTRYEEFMTKTEEERDEMFRDTEEIEQETATTFDTTKIVNFKKFNLE